MPRLVVLESCACSACRNDLNLPFQRFGALRALKKKKAAANEKKEAPHPPAQGRNRFSHYHLSRTVRKVWAGERFCPDRKMTRAVPGAIFPPLSEA